MADFKQQGITEHAFGRYAPRPLLFLLVQNPQLGWAAGALPITVQGAYCPHPREAISNGSLGSFKDVS